MLKGHTINEESKLGTIKCLTEGGFAKGTSSHCYQHDCILWAQKSFSVSLFHHLQCNIWNTSVCKVYIYCLFGSPNKKKRQFLDELQPLIWFFLKFYLPCIYTVCNVTVALSLRGGVGFLYFESGLLCDLLWSVECSRSDSGLKQKFKV